MKTVNARDKAWAVEIRCKGRAYEKYSASALKVEMPVENLFKKPKPSNGKFLVNAGDWGEPTELDKHVRTALRCTTPALIRET